MAIKKKIIRDNLLMNLLKIITPFEMERLTVKSVSKEKRSLTQMLTNKILGRSEAKDEKAQDTEKEAVDDQANAEDKKDEEGTQNEKNPPNSKNGKEKVNVNVFILDELKKSEKSQKRLKGREVLETYQETGSVTIEQEKMMKDDLSKSTSLGLLINKKQS
ncbi:MAG: hypothetical protein ISR65_14310 [Bacteriovoracaceae bacterium]|nr:hypothetical protein [Bacteriovoracaceae bacterium]